jgi:hypothetical protein
MLNLHSPFRRATAADEDAVKSLTGGRTVTGAETVVAEEKGRVVAVLAGRPSGEAWHVEAIAVSEERMGELGPRILRVADVLAAEDELGAVTLKPDSLGQGLRSLLQEEGFRPAEGHDGLMIRPVVPQG